MAVAGEIAAELKTAIPVTWDALVKDARYGESFLQRKVDQTKYNLFGEIVEPSTEDIVYNPTVIEYAGKKAALNVIPAAAEYWAQQKVLDNAGTRVSGTWVDRVSKLWDLYDRLLKEVSELAVEVGELTPSVISIKTRRKPIGVTLGQNPDYLTPDVEAFPRQAVVPTGA